MARCLSFLRARAPRPPAPIAPGAAGRAASPVARLTQVAGAYAHDENVDLGVELPFVVLGRGNLCEPRTIAQQALGILCLGRGRRLFQIGQQPLADVDAHRLIIIRHEERNGAERDAYSAHFEREHGCVAFSMLRLTLGGLAAEDQGAAAGAMAMCPRALSDPFSRSLPL